MADIAGVEDDGELVAAFQRARPDERQQAFCALYERHAGPLRGYLVRLTRDPHLADDLTQEAFLHALDGLDGFSGRSSFRTWMYRIATNLFKDHLRRKGPVVNGELVAQEAARAALSPDELAEQGEDVRRVRAAVAALPDDLRAPLILVRFDGMKYREAAEVLGITMEAVRMRVHRAHMALTTELGGKG